MFQRIFEKIKEQLDLDDEIREITLKSSRKSVRCTQEAIRAIHKGEFVKAREKIMESQNLIEEVEKKIKETSPHLYYKGYVTIMYQEFVEASLFLTLIEGNTKIPGPEFLHVSNDAYLQGVGDLIGEIRRYSLNCIRKGDFEKAEKCLVIMEEIYDLLHILDYPEGLIPGIRHKIDVARSLIEKTRSELSYFQHGNTLADSMNKLLEKLKNTKSKKS